ncbi:hypothetical protein [Agaribacterium haliotis]|uniref:hypothetical protein n=1 Tax=Agaribacterium haliotis TaxID=2013869 RepID=UPI0019596AA7|nr:hypothetical protein [Agaribacterium haliotis]
MYRALLIFLLFVSANTIATSNKYCDEIQRLRIWAQGSDQYGIWVEYQENPAACSGGFFVKHDANNKDLLVSFLLAEKAQGNKVCIQAITDESTMINGRCRVNYVYNP